MEKCCVKGCDNLKYVGTKKLMYFNFPYHNENLMKIWLQRINKPDLDPKNHKICSRHFTINDVIYRSNGSMPYLKPTSIPSLFPVDANARDEKIEKNEKLATNIATWKATKDAIVNDKQNSAKIPQGSLILVTSQNPRQYQPIIPLLVPIESPRRIDLSADSSKCSQTNLQNMTQVTKACVKQMVNPNFAQVSPLSFLLIQHSNSGPQILDNSGEDLVKTAPSTLNIPLPALTPITNSNIQNSTQHPESLQLNAGQTNLKNSIQIILKLNPQNQVKNEGNSAEKPSTMIQNPIQLISIPFSSSQSLGNIFQSSQTQIQHPTQILPILSTNADDSAIASKCFDVQALPKQSNSSCANVITCAEISQALQKDSIQISQISQTNTQNGVRIDQISQTNGKQSTIALSTVSDTKYRTPTKNVQNPIQISHISQSNVRATIQNGQMNVEKLGERFFKATTNETPEISVKNEIQYAQNPIQSTQICPVNAEDTKKISETTQVIVECSERIVKPLQQAEKQNSLETPIQILSSSPEKSEDAPTTRLVENLESTFESDILRNTNCSVSLEPTIISPRSSHKKPTLIISINKYSNVTSKSESNPIMDETRKTLTSEDISKKEITIENSATNKSVTFRLDRKTGEIVVETREMVAPSGENKPIKRRKRKVYTYRRQLSARLCQRNAKDERKRAAVKLEIRHERRIKRLNEDKRNRRGRKPLLQFDEKVQKNTDSSNSKIRRFKRKCEALEIDELQCNNKKANRGTLEIENRQDGHGSTLFNSTPRRQLRKFNVLPKT